MRIHLAFLSIIAIINISAFSQSEPDTTRHWKSGGSTAINFSQVSLTNWAAGGENSVSGTFLFNAFMNYTKGKTAWENTLDVGYGLTKQGAENMIKTEDRFQLVSKYGRQASRFWYYTALADFKTQLDKGYKDPPENSILTSKFLSPAYLLLSLGMDYKPNDNFSLYLSPLTGKWTIVNDDELSQQGAFGVDPGKNVRSEFGASLKSIFKKENIIENVDFMTRLDLFSNYSNNPQNIDVEWETKFDFRVNSFLSANLGTTLLFDDDIKYITDEGVERGARIQFKQLFGFGINFKF
ncbi:DUF3078 domain-containing protein [Thermophagus xiamenensis]|uniref:DUF3078 domain-containing protein n=1 Tax=Thermophagus xiamenensis TaxID=385682 RepID=A0A1I2BVH0_9BACT|nr:DUF3078 domain-containing protein [Thermophagus xiamenensis]SFE60146.1 Protein of unknown function [Thermophagus xiamenensis]